MDAYALLEELWDTGHYSDLTVICGGGVFRVHKNIVCKSSTWFEKICAEGRWKEGSTNTIHLKSIHDDKPTAVSHDAFLDDDEELSADESDVGRTYRIDPKEDYSLDHPDAVELMLYFLYHGNYALALERLDCIDPSAASSGKLQMGRLAYHARLFGLGVKYDIPGLRSYALEQFNKDASLPRRFRTRDLAHTVRIAWGTATEPFDVFQKAVMLVVVAHMAALVVQSEIREAFDSIPGLAWEWMHMGCKMQSRWKRSSSGLENIDYIETKRLRLGCP